MRPKDKSTAKRVSGERVAILLSEARGAFSEKPERSRRYCALAFLIVKKNKVRLSRAQKLSFCRKCFSFWLPGKSAAVSFDRRNKRVIYRCAACGYERRIGYAKKRS